MPGPRMTTDALKERGRKHLSKAEEAARRAGEVNVLKAKTAKPPKWLPAELTKDFRAIGKKLIAAGIYTDLDADSLGRYLVAHQHYVASTEQLNEAFAAEEPDLGIIDAWSKIQERHFKQARNCANDLGLTVTSRCRLVVPEGNKQASEETNPFLQLIQGGAVKHA